MFLQNLAGDEIPDVKVFKHSNNETGMHLVCGMPLNSITLVFSFVSNVHYQLESDLFSCISTA